MLNVRYFDVYPGETAPRPRFFILPISCDRLSRPGTSEHVIIKEEICHSNKNNNNNFDFMVTLMLFISLCRPIKLFK